MPSDDTASLTLERFRRYLEVLAEVHIDPRLRARSMRRGLCSRRCSKPIAPWFRLRAGPRRNASPGCAVSWRTEPHRRDSRVDRADP
jgi:hypothetical protein